MASAREIVTALLMLTRCKNDRQRHCVFSIFPKPKVVLLPFSFQQAAHEVIYDGEALQFPNFRDAKPIEQAKRNAKWLANYLAKKTGEPVQVVPLVVLPRWFVKIAKKGNFPVWVMNTTYLPKHLLGQREQIDPAQVRRIISAIDDKCRDVEF